MIFFRADELLGSKLLYYILGSQFQCHIHDLSVWKIFCFSSFEDFGDIFIDMNSFKVPTIYSSQLFMKFLIYFVISYKIMQIILMELPTKSYSSIKYLNFHKHLSPQLSTLRLPPTKTYGHPVYAINRDQKHCYEEKNPS